MSRLLLRTYMFLRRNLWKRSLDEIHVEAVYSDDAYANLFRYVEFYSKTNLMLSCPLQDLWHRMRTQATKVPEEKYQSRVELRYVELRKRFRNPMGVHVHLIGPCSVNVPSYEEQYALIKEAKDYFDGLGLPTEDFAAGWNRYNDDTIKVCENLGFKRFHVSQVRCGCEVSDKLKFVMVYNVGHDWSLK